MFDLKTLIFRKKKLFYKFYLIPPTYFNVYKNMYVISNHIFG